MTRGDKPLLIICASVVLTLGILIYVLPQENFSEGENRYLTRLNAPSAESVFSGEYFKTVSSFYSDQFPLRSYATALYSISERSIGKREVRGVIIYGEQLIARQSKKPTYSPPAEAIIIEGKYSTLESGGDLSLYYKTDHHLTTRGAYFLYLEVCMRIGVSPYPEDYFKKQTACTDFYGTSFFKSQLPRQSVSPDSIELWRYQGDEDIRLTVDGSNCAPSGLYDMAKLLTVDKYSVFLGGNYALASIRSSPTLPTILIVKDSFANAVAPFLALHFNIDLIDPRYATPSQLSTALSNPYEHKLFIGCLDSF